jgi:hypothetical protein
LHRVPNLSSNEEEEVLFFSNLADQKTHPPPPGTTGFTRGGRRKGLRRDGTRDPGRMSRRSRLLAKADYNGTTGSARGVPCYV